MKKDEQKEINEVNNNIDDSQEEFSIPVVMKHLGKELVMRKTRKIPIIPIRETVLFPHSIVPLVAGKDISKRDFERLVKDMDSFGVVFVPGAEGVDFEQKDLSLVGTEARILKLVHFPNGGRGVLIQGMTRFRVQSYENFEEGPLAAEVEDFEVLRPLEHQMEFVALSKNIKQLVLKAMGLSPHFSQEASIFIDQVNDAEFLADSIVPHLSMEILERQRILEEGDLFHRLQLVHQSLVKEIEILEMSHKIHTGVQNEIGKHQRRFYIKEQQKALQKELYELEGRAQTEGGIEGEDTLSFEERILQSLMPLEARQAAMREVERLKQIPPSTPEYTVSTTYINWLLDIPWGIYSQEVFNLKEARKILDEDHYGLEKVKKRILEFLALFSINNQVKGSILLLSGPPGVGKTSLGKSIARALNRPFFRMALGGMRDEAEIRGHRRTYIGSMPGKLADALKKSRTMDPVILLDEVDKIGADHRGDPSSALLEVLDPEQNHTFTDHYLNVSMDLSRVFFICTANTLHTIPAPLRDRLEIIEVGGYVESEKLNIAQNYIIPSVIKDYDIQKVAKPVFAKNTLKTLIQDYTREAGVRQLKREIQSVMRHVAMDVLEEPQKQGKKFAITLDFLKKSLGKAKYSSTKKNKDLSPGVSIGLAYTSVGGDILYIESVFSKEGQGKLQVTGQLGDVMKESVSAALSLILSKKEKFGLEGFVLKDKDLHIHFPEGAVPKDGPSAGVAIFLSLLSLFLGKSLPSDLAMTGEISLRGQILPIGGLKEKLVAAHRCGMKTILIPKENEKDLDDVPQEVLQHLKIMAVSEIEDVVEKLRLIS